MTSERYTLEQLQTLMVIAGSEDPLTEALQIRARWGYIQEVAKQAEQGIVIDYTLPQIVRHAAHWAEYSAGILAVLDEWIAEHASGRRG